MPARRDATGQWRYRKIVRLADGTRVRISGTPAINTKGDAEREERAHIARTLAPPATTARVPTLAEFVPRYLEQAELRQSASELAGKRQRLARHILPMLGAVRLDHIGRADLDALRLALRTRSPRTINNYLTVVGAILAYAAELGIIATRPALGLLAIPPQPFSQYSDDEIDALAAAGTTHERTAILLGADAGLRAGEIRALRRDDIGQDRLRVICSDWYGQTKAPKSGRARTIPMTARLAEAVRASLASHAGPTVLARPNGLAWTREVMRAAIARLCLATGLEQRGWHALRHAFASRLAAAGAPARTIQALAGHASITTTERYMHLGPDATAQAVALLERGGKNVPNFQRKKT